MTSQIPLDTQDLFFAQAANHRILTACEEREALQTWQAAVAAKAQVDLGLDVPELQQVINKGEAAKATLITHNVRLVIKFADYYSKRTGIPLMDLVQDGCIGLIKGIENFDLSHGCKLSTYVSHWIRHHVIRSISNNSRLVRLPVHVGDTLVKLYKKKGDLEQKHKGEVPLDLLAQEMNWSIEKLKRVMTFSKPALSLDKPMGDDEGSDDLHLIVSDIEENDKDDELSQTIQQLMMSLKPRQVTIMKLRYGLDGNKPHKLHEIGEKLGITRERVRQIEKETLRKLRHPTRVRRLREFL